MSGLLEECGRPKQNLAFPCSGGFMQVGPLYVQYPEFEKHLERAQSLYRPLQTKVYYAFDSHSQEHRQSRAPASFVPSLPLLFNKPWLWEVIAIVFTNIPAHCF